MKYFEYTHEQMDYLRQRDPQLGECILRHGKIMRELTPDLFSALVDSIISQQISSKAANTVCGRFKTLVLDVTPENVHTLAIEEIQQCGMSMRKAGYIKNMTDAVLSGQIDLSVLSVLSDDEVIKRLCVLNGVGRWTVEMLLIFSLGRMNIFSKLDFGIRHGLLRVHHLETLTKEDLDGYQRLYAPYASVASLYLWAAANE